MMNKLKGFTIIEVLIVVGVAFLMIGALAPFARMTKERAHRIECENNLRKISLGLHMYASEHDGAFPATLGELYPNYVDNEKVFDCPSSKSRGTKDSPDYDYTAGLTESSPIREVIAKDKAGNHKKSGCNALKIDGSVFWAGGR